MTKCIPLSVINKRHAVSPREFLNIKLKNPEQLCTSQSLTQSINRNALDQLDRKNDVQRILNNGNRGLRCSSKLTSKEGCCGITSVNRHSSH